MSGSWQRMALLVALALAMVSCGEKPPPPPTIVNLTFRATADVNPGPTGDPAPIALRYYQLSGRAAFSNAEFFQIFDQDDATLKSDSIKHEEYVLAPGETKTASVTPEPNAKWLGFFAAFRDYTPVTWRAVAEIPPNKTTNLTVNAARGGITVAPTPVQGP